MVTGDQTCPGMGRGGQAWLEEGAEVGKRGSAGGEGRGGVRVETWVAEMGRNAEGQWGRSWEPVEGTGGPRR